MNVLMISIGDSILSNPIGDSLIRQQEYAKRLGYIDMIIYSPKKNNLIAKHYENLSIYPTKSINMTTFVFDVLRIAKDILKKKKIDVITTQDPFGTALAGYFIKRQYNIPLHIQNHSSFLDNKLWISERPLLFRLFNKIAYFTLKRADRLRVVNHQEKKKYIDILKINPDKIDVAPVPIDIDFWQKKIKDIEKEKFLNRFNIDKSIPILSWVGRSAKVKNIPYLFKAVSLVNKQKKVNLLIAGDMNNYLNLKNLESKFNIKPIYLGRLNHKDLRILYNITDIFLHTSDYEGFGLVIAEAHASGCVVVSRKTDGAMDIIEDNKSGFLIEKGEKEFSKKVLFLLENNELLYNMSNYAKEMMKVKFNKEEMFKKVISSIKVTKVTNV